MEKAVAIGHLLLKKELFFDQESKVVNCCDNSPCKTRVFVVILKE